MANMVERRRAWHAIIAFGQHTRLNDVEHDIASPLLYNTHSRTTLGVACHHRLWAAHTVERRRAWHATIAFGQHKRSNNAGKHAITALGQHTRSNDVRHGMTSLLFDNRHAQTTSGME